MKRALLLLCLLLPTAAWAAPLPAGAVTGFWRVKSGDAVIHIVRRGGHYRGRLVWLRQARYPDNDPRGIGGRALTDRHNADPDKRGRPLLGLALLTGLTYHVDDGDAVWQGGQIYNTQNGKRYRCSVRLADRDHLTNPIRGNATSQRACAW